MSKAKTVVISGGFACLLIAAGLSVGGGAPPSKDVDWPGVGGQPGEQHYGALSQINEQTVGKLGLAWSLDLDGEHTLEATPIEVDGVLYFSGDESTVYAVDAVSGKLLWHFDPERSNYRPDHLRLIFPVNRGVAYSHGKVIVGTLDGRLIALDAKSGKPVWTVKTVPDNSLKSITGAPRVFNDKVIIGNGGGDAGERAYVTAYDVNTGRQAWRFYIVPGNPADGFENAAMKAAAATWSGEWWKVGTGGSAWDSMTYDPELNRIYIGTGNSGPYNPALRNPGGGDNLYVASIVALDADTGRYIWHYQVNPNESWDYKATANIALGEMTVNGAKKKVLMQVPTNGFFYLIDRETGKLISADKAGKVTWASGIDLKTGRPIEAPNIRYQNGPVTFWPSPYGLHNWQPMSYDPASHLAFIPAMKLGVGFQVDPQYLAHPTGRSTKEPYAGEGSFYSLKKIDADDGTGSLVAWDTLAHRPRWQVHYPHIWNGGTLATAGGLVFQGDGEGILHAYQSSTGKEAWRFDAKLGIISAPITYSVRGTQYVSILVGFGGATGFGSDFVSHGWKYNAQPRRLLTFALGRTAALPPTPPRDMTVAAIDDPGLKLDEAAVSRGAQIYGGSCTMCHGLATRSAGVPGPDLRESAVASREDTLAELLKTGPLQENGMPKFDELTPDQVHSLYMYIRATSREALGKRAATAAPASSHN